MKKKNVEVCIGVSPAHEVGSQAAWATHKNIPIVEAFREAAEAAKKQATHLDSLYSVLKAHDAPISIHVTEGDVIITGPSDVMDDLVNRELATPGEPHIEGQYAA